MCKYFKLSLTFFSFSIVDVTSIFKENIYYVNNSKRNNKNKRYFIDFFYLRN